jgi:hypothetical protein
MEEHISIALKMKECRVTARKIYGDKYPEKIQPYKDIIALVQKANKMDVLQAIHKITQEPEVWEKEGARVMFLAAAVEMIDAS